MRLLVTPPSRLVRSGAGTPAAHASIEIRDPAAWRRPWPRATACQAVPQGAVVITTLWYTAHASSDTSSKSHNLGSDHLVVSGRPQALDFGPGDTAFYTEWIAHLSRSTYSSSDIFNLPDEAVVSPEEGSRSSSRLKRLSFSKSGPTTLMPTTFCRVSVAVGIRVAVPQACMIARVEMYLVDLHENEQVVALQIHLVSRTNYSRDGPDNLIPGQFFIVSNGRPNRKLMRRVSLYTYACTSSSSMPSTPI